MLGPLLAGPYRVDVLENYMECRRILEVEAAGLAAERAREDDLRGDAAGAGGDGAGGRRDGDADQRGALPRGRHPFHQALIGGTRNRALCSLTESIHAAVLTTRFWLARPEYRLQRAMPEHRAIFAAVLAQDPDAARAAMSAHLATVESYISAHNGARAVGSGA